MKRLLAILIYLPALIAWVILVLTWKFAYKVMPYPRADLWAWLGCIALLEGETSLRRNNPGI